MPNENHYLRKYHCLLASLTSLGKKEKVIFCEGCNSHKQAKNEIRSKKLAIYVYHDVGHIPQPNRP
jgi:uncharacterized UBP type Zn finger protein